MIRFISSEEKEKTSLPWKKGVIKTLSAMMVISPMVALVPTAAQAMSVVGALPAVGDGTSNSPYIITSPEELYYMNTVKNGYYKLGANIDLSNYEWSPINNFAGSLDGAGHYIKNLKITQYNKDIGLFGFIGPSGVVKNLGILHADIAISSGSDLSYVGIIAGVNMGSIQNSHVSGQIKVTGITYLYRYGTEGVTVGGLVGLNVTPGKITNCLAQVDLEQSGYVADEDFGIIGGLVGLNGSFISNSYFVGTAKNLVPSFHFFTPGGSVGGQGSYSTVATFWDSTVGGSIDNGSGGTPKSTTEMKSQQTYVGWDFTNVWSIQEGVTYPFLRNYQPTVQEIPDKAINIADGSYSIDLTSSFTDPAGDPLKITAVSSDTTLLTAQLNGNQLLLTPIAQGTVTVTATAENSQGAVVTDSFVVTVAPAGSVTGVVNGPGNSPISGASVSIGGISDVTDALGQFTLTNISAGSQTVTVNSTGYNNGSATVTVTAGQSLSAGTITLTPVQTTGSVTGAVYGPGNSPISGASVSIGGISDVTDALGQFTLTNISPGSQTVTVSSTGYNNGSATVTVTAGQSVNAGTITLTPVQTTGSVTGVVNGPGNSPISGASVSIGGISDVTDALGQFTLTNISPGSQTVTVSSTGYNNGSATVTVTAGQSVNAGTITLTEVVTTGIVTGVVNGPGNSPISGASVSIGGISDVTDALGQFTLTNISPGSQTVTVSSTGYNNGSATVTVTAGQSVSAGTITLTPVQTTGSVTGAVYGPGNSPISGASVSIGGISDVTDALGQFTLTNISPGSQTVTVSSTGYNNGSATVTITAGQSVSAGTITLTEVVTTGTVTGVVNGPGNSPISGASVSIGGISDVTDALGQFTLTNISPGSQTVTVSSTGYNNGSATVMVTAGQSVNAGTITLTPVQTTGSVIGAVYGPGNSPISGASVSIGGISDVTDALGQFTLTNISAGSQTVTVSSTGYNNGSATVTITAGQSVSAGTITLTEVVTTGTVTGVVNGPGNSPISGASVSIGGISDVTDALGQFTLSNISAGSQTITVSSTGYNNGSATVTVTAGQNVSTGTITLTEVVTTGTVTGVVNGPGNSPISGASVSIGGISDVTDALGQFTLTNISPGSQTVTVSSTGYNNGSATVTITAGQSVSAGTITLTEVVTTGTVTGVVNGPGNSPISGASVSIGGISDVTDALGQFTLTNISPGSQTVTVSSTGYNNGSATVTVTAGQNVNAGTITLTEVVTTGTVTGVVNGPGNSPISGASVSIGGISDVTDALGQFTLTNISPGSQTVTVSSTGYNNGSATVTVTAGQSVSAGTISLTAVTATTPTGPITPTLQIPPTTPEPSKSIDSTPAGANVFNSGIIDTTKLISFLENKVEVANQSPVSLQFSDTKGHWAEQTISAFVKLGAIQGNGKGEFNPNGTITRSEFSTIMVRVFNIQSGTATHSSFTDITGHWGSDAILKLAQAGVIKGYADSTFHPDQSISREEMVVILTRILNLDSVSKDSTKGEFTDLSNSFAVEGIKEAVQAGIINGKTIGKFEPKSSATRAEALTIIMNALSLDPQLKLLLDSLK